MVDHYRLVINGEQVESSSGKTHPVLNPATGEVLAYVAEGGEEDINRAVMAAKNAFPKWKKVKPRDRARLLRQLAGLIEGNVERLALLETRNVGKPIRDTRGEIQSVAQTFYYYAGAIDKMYGNTIPVQADGHLLTFREPIGVVGLITPWNFPLLIASWKLAPALACGNTIVLKPASLTPLTTIELAKLALEAGIPEGVFNVVTGPGSTAGNRIATHPDIEKISFTGSTDVGAQIMRQASSTIKNVSLELGGKSPSLIFEDADVDRAAHNSVMAAFENCGQNCCARSRVLIHESIYDDFVQKFIKHAKKIVVGHPEDINTEIGPLISRQQRQISLDYIEKGISEGAEILIGGTIPDHLPSGGNYLMPTVLVNVRNDMTVAQEEIFGPVTAFIPFKDEEEAIAIANDTTYGLSGSLWTKDSSRLFRVSRELKTGVLSVNSTSSVHLEAPFGGVKQSGIGRELGLAALDHYSELKTVFIANE